MKQPPTSLKIFRDFLRRRQDGSIDASLIASKECLETWIKSRQGKLNGPPLKMFRRALSGHLTGVDGRSPFLKEEEEAILIVARNKQMWLGLQGEEEKPDLTKKQGYILGFRAKGFHERLHAGEFQELTVVKKRARLAVEEASKMKALDQAKPPAPSPDSTDSAVSLDDQQDVSTLVTLTAQENCKPHHQTPSLTSWCEAFVRATTSVAMRPAMSSVAWSSSYEVGRMILLSNVKFVPPTIDNALNMLHKTLPLPHDVLLIVSLVASSYEERILAQNQASIPLLGTIALSENSRAPRRIFPLSHVPQLWAAFGQMLATPRTETPFEIDLYLRDGRVQSCYVFGVYDSDVHLGSLRFMFKHQ